VGSAAGGTCWARPTRPDHSGTAVRRSRPSQRAGAFNFYVSCRLGSDAWRLLLDFASFVLFLPQSYKILSGGTTTTPGGSPELFRVANLVALIRCPNCPLLAWEGCGGPALILGSHGVTSRPYFSRLGRPACGRKGQMSQCGRFFCGKLSCGHCGRFTRATVFRWRSTPNPTTQSL
jgi:hypothetical protein